MTPTSSSIMTAAEAAVDRDEPVCGKRVAA
jgi:hypothetical protein